MKSIIASLGTEEIKRIRIGIDKAANDTIDYVLGKFTKVEKKEIDVVIAQAPDMINYYLRNSFDGLMNKYN